MAIEIDMDSAEPYIMKGIALARQERQEEAMQCYDRAMELKDYENGIHTLKGISLVKMGRYEEAMQCYDRAMEMTDGGMLICFTGRVCICTSGEVRGGRTVL